MGIATPVCGLVRDDSILLPLRRVNGRTRQFLPIETAAPGPCSSVFSVPTLTKRGSLTGQVQITLPFTAFLKYLSHYSPKYPYLSTGNVNYRLAY